MPALASRSPQRSGRAQSAREPPRQSQPTRAARAGNDQYRAARQKGQTEPRLPPPASLSRQRPSGDAARPSRRRSARRPQKGDPEKQSHREKHRAESDQQAWGPRALLRWRRNVDARYHRSIVELSEASGLDGRLELFLEGPKSGHLGAKSVLATLEYRIERRGSHREL